MGGDVRPAERTINSMEASHFGFPPSFTANSTRTTSRFFGIDCQRHCEKCIVPVAARAPFRYLTRATD